MSNPLDLLELTGALDASFPPSGVSAICQFWSTPATAPADATASYPWRAPPSPPAPTESWLKSIISPKRPCLTALNPSIRPVCHHDGRNRADRLGGCPPPPPRHPHRRRS